MCSLTSDVLREGMSSPLSPYQFLTLSRALSLDLSLVARPLSLALARARAHTHTHTPGFYYVDTVHWRTFPEEFRMWRERPRRICLSSCEERGYMSYEENGIGHTHAHTYTCRSHTHTYTYRSHTRTHIHLQVTHAHTYTCRSHPRIHPRRCTCAEDTYQMSSS